jgi:hypothetical protein
VVRGPVIKAADSYEARRDTHAGLERVCAHFPQLRPSLAGVRRRDPQVGDAIRHQIPFLLRHPGSPTVRDAEALARHVLAGA